MRDGSTCSSDRPRLGSSPASIHVSARVTRLAHSLATPLSLAPRRRSSSPSRRACAPRRPVYLASRRPSSSSLPHTASPLLVASPRTAPPLLVVSPSHRATAPPRPSLEAKKRRGSPAERRRSAKMTSVTGKLSRAAETASSDAQAIIKDMRKALGTMKSLAVDYERDGKSEEVQKLEKMVLEIAESYDDCVAFSQAIKAVPESYAPSDQPTDFKGLIETEVSKIKEGLPASRQKQNHPLFRQFREAVWNVHHEGQPMPGEEQNDVVMTSTQTSIKNNKCPITGKHVTELPNPVRCVDCGHIYERDPIQHYIRNQKPPNCPIAGCFAILQICKVVCDPLLDIEIEEFRSLECAAPNATNVEDLI